MEFFSNNVGIFPVCRKYEDIDNEKETGIPLVPTLLKESNKPKQVGLCPICG
jgi:hypothetical protein